MNKRTNPQRNIKSIKTHNQSTSRSNEKVLWRPGASSYLSVRTKHGPRFQEGKTQNLCSEHTFKYMYLNMTAKPPFQALAKINVLVEVYKYLQVCKCFQAAFDW